MTPQNILLTLSAFAIFCGGWTAGRKEGAGDLPVAGVMMAGIGALLFALTLSMR